ncbi:MAG: 16S rRNA (adenine(1518)-N(6)/adenine(1519)-N(6))-dimethyltransferase RsmA [Gammaproteobacteria bacterium]|nr:16S rRNA (adenine(1518)-N(6)/adenine(1519)-N(6))-dimethyltransferase RsmA [Gammaproteobacteria bacterium]MDE0252316.1 16S rRNA (adenine(1518)-N(6)/adenine(1519)-N(6))-dimethyltransferase RsmA [Gammaproteobacteria bacterium]MDE0402575.1 16S rRNA (adenine(1518)-N(6)/adenine(1519)-N(6))-dimethyltransferase RsmA [Gammaproteobacteria bacterium]
MPLQPRKRFGQHFLVDVSVIADIHEVLNISRNDRVLEIGAGYGNLTRGLVATGAELVVVEIDKVLVNYLRKHFLSTTIIEGDILRLEADIFSSRRVVGNLPYGISTPLLINLYEFNNTRDLHFMLQKELADRLVATPNTKSWGRLSVKMQHMFDITTLFEVPSDAFDPPPAVTSAFVRFDRKKIPLEINDMNLFDIVLTAAFNQRRKKISSSLKKFMVDWDTVCVDVNLRGDQLNVADFVNIANSLFSEP